MAGSSKNFDKKGSYFESWPEMWFLLLLVLGLISAIAAPNNAFLYTISFLAGVMAGRVWHQRRKMMHIPHLLIIIGALIGIFLGSLTKTASRGWMFLLFIIGSIISYQLHVKGYIR